MTGRAGKGRNQVSRRALLVLLAVGLPAAFAGCLSPTLPLPPPSRPDVWSPDEDGNVRVKGVAQSRATVFVHNQRTDEIVGEVTRSDGAYDLLIAAEVGDRLSIWQSIGTKESPSTEVIVPATSIIGDTPAPPEEMGGASGR